MNNSRCCLLIPRFQPGAKVTVKQLGLVLAAGHLGFEDGGSVGELLSGISRIWVCGNAVASRVRLSFSIELTLKVWDFGLVRKVQRSPHPAEGRQVGRHLDTVFREY
jgi:hypothetical protein